MMRQLLAALRVLALAIVSCAALAPAGVRAQEVTTPDRTAEIQAPQLVTFVEAEYPGAARDAGRSGTVVLQLTIDAEGKVTSADVLESAGHDFDQAARAAALRFLFSPARRSGAPVPSRIAYEYSFQLPPAAIAGTLEGRVFAPGDGRPVPGADVVVQGEKGSMRSLRTDDGGRFRVEELAPGSYSVKASLHALGRAEAHVQLFAGQTADIALRLLRAVRETPIEVTVTQRPVRTPGALHVIGKRTLERYRYDDVHAVVQTVPGVYVRQEDGLGLRPNIGLRGAASDRSQKITLMEDGVLLAPAPYSAPAAYYFPILSRMSQVRVIKGPSAISYGPQTIGGAIDFVTRPYPSDTRGELDVAAGQYGYGKLHAWAGTSANEMGFLLEGIHLRSDGYKQLPGGDDTGFYRNEWVVKASYRPDPRDLMTNEISIKASYSDELSNETYLGLSDEDFRNTPLRRYAASKLDEMTWKRTGISVTHQILPREDLSIETTAYRNDLSRRWRKVNRFAGANLFDVLTNPDTPSNAIYHAILNGELDASAPSETLLVGPNLRDFVAQGIQTRAKWNRRTGPLAHELEYGLRLHHDRIERNHTEDAFVAVQGELAATGAPTAVTTSNEAWTEAVAFHVNDQMSWDRLTLSPGLRVELMRSALVNRLTGVERRGTARVILPGVGAAYRIGEAGNVFAGIYRGFSPPAPGNPDSAGPELSTNYEAGFRYLDQPTRAEVIGYYNDYSNLTDICTQSSGCSDTAVDTQFSAGRAKIYGLEAYAAQDIPTGAMKWLFSAAYTLTLTEFLRSFDSVNPSFGSVRAGDELPYVPRHQAHASVALESPRADAYATATYVSKMRERAGSGSLEGALTTDAQLTFDIGARFRFLPRLELYANARNLLDSAYLVSRRPYGARPNAPRWLQFGVVARF